MYEIKNLEATVADVDDTSRRVKVAMNKTGVQDLDKDTLERTAFDVTIRERGPKGANLIWHLTDHRASLKDAVGKPSELGVDSNGYLYFVTDIQKTNWGNDVLEFYKGLVINQHSIGFSTVKREVFNADDWANRYTVIKEVKLYEGSAVLWGANPFTPTITVGKSLSPEQHQSEFNKTLEEYEACSKMWKSGHLSDSSFELLDMRIKQLNEKMKNLYNVLPVVKTTEQDKPAENAVDPDVNSKLFEVLKTFNQQKHSHHDTGTITSGT